MQICAIGLNHHKTPIAIRERFALPKKQVHEGLQTLKRHGVQEVAILSTCNRTEIYCHTADLSPIHNWLSTLGQMNATRLAPHLFFAPSRDAVRHIFRVAAGLDSMVIGESNIFGQVKDAVRLANENRTLSGTLHRLFQKAFATAKEIRHSTDIGRHGVSMATVAVQLAENIFDDIESTRVLFIGTGEMINLCATHFCAHRPIATMFLSRELSRAHQSAQRFGGEAGLIGDLEHIAQEYDIIVSCTETTLPIIGSGLTQRILKKRQHKPIMMMDLAVPRNIEPEAGGNPDVFLYSVDDLQTVIEDNLHNRKQESSKAELIISARVDDFMRYLDHRRGVSTIQSFKQTLTDIAERENTRALRQIKRGEDPQKVLAELTHRLSHQWMHPWFAHLQAVEGRALDDTLTLYQSVLKDQRRQALTAHHSPSIDPDFGKQRK